MEKKTVTDELRASLLLRSEMFRGMTAAQTARIVKLSGAADGFYKRGDSLLREGDRPAGFGIILEGMVQSSRNMGGGRVVFRSYHPGELLAEDLVFSGSRVSSCDFTAMEETWVVWIEIPHSMEVLSRRCEDHTKLLHNLIRITASKNMALLERIQVLTRKTMRERVLYYLGLEAEKYGSRTFEIPFTREELADYLGVDRSALSRILSALKKEGAIENRGKQFTINF